MWRSSLSHHASTILYIDLFALHPTFFHICECTLYFSFLLGSYFVYRTRTPYISCWEHYPPANELSLVSVPTLSTHECMRTLQQDPIRRIPNVWRPGPTNSHCTGLPTDVYRPFKKLSLMWSLPLRFLQLMSRSQMPLQIDREEFAVILLCLLSLLEDLKHCIRIDC